MLTEDPSLNPQVALSWVIHAANSLQNVEGCVPFQLVFGKIPKHPSLIEDNPGANEVLANSQTQWAQHYRTMMAAREHYIAAETDPALRETLGRKLHTEPTAVNKGDWIYFRKISDKHWKGPAKVVLKESKSLHCIMRGDPLIIDIDDIHINKPNAQEMKLEDLMYIPNNQQPLVRPAVPDRHGREETKETTEPSLPIPTTHDDNNKSEAKEEDLTSHQNQFTQTTVEGHQTTSNQESPDNQQDPANSTLPIDLGFPIMCNLCSREISSKNFFRHCSIDHNIERPNIRKHAVKISAKPDSIYQNHGKLKPGVVVASDDGDYIILEQPTILGWSTTNINTKETKDLELVRDMAEMRYLGRFDSKTEEGIFITDDDNKVVFIEFGAYCRKVFFTAQTNYHEENVFVV